MGVGLLDLQEGESTHHQKVLGHTRFTEEAEYEEEEGQAGGGDIEEAQVEKEENNAGGGQGGEAKVEEKRELGAAAVAQGTESGSHPQVTEGICEEVREEEDDYNEDDKRVLLSINVELEDDRPSTLLILREGDSPSEVAERFCREQSLPDRFIDILIHHIVENLQHLGEDQNEVSSPSDEHCLVGEAWSESEHEVGNDKNEIFSRPITQEKHAERNFTSLQEIRKAYDGNILTVKPMPENTCQQLQNGNQRRSQMFSDQISASSLRDNLELQAKSGNGKSRSRRSSKKNNAYVRLYVEFMRQEQRLEEEKRRLLEQYREKMEREKPVYSKKTRRIMQMRGRAAKQFRNYGELLYQEALKKENEKKKMIEQKHLEDQANELKGVTRKPEISKLAKKIKQAEKVWDRLCREKPKRDIRELRNEALTSTLMECTFRPRTNHCSERFLVERQDGTLETTNRFDQLFWDAEHRRRRQAEYSQWYPEGVTFHPAINRARQSAVYYSDGHNGDDNVFNRLLQYSSKITEKRQRLQQEVKRPIDPITGQQLFRPQTGRRPNSQWNSSALPIGDFLYQLKFVMDNRKQSLAEKEEQKKKELANYHYASHKSHQLLERLKERCLQQIFDGLDVDKDGYVDLNAVDTNHLDSGVAADIGEMKKSVVNNPINFNEFLSLMDAVQKKRKGPQFWLKYCRRHKDGEKLVGFKMDQYSRQLTSGRMGFGNGQKWYEFVLLERERKLARLEAMRKEREDQELAQCTFKPLIHSKTTRESPRLMPAAQEHGHTPQQPTVLEKEKHELHGFIFQESSSEVHDSTNSSDRSSGVDLVESLKQMMSVDSLEDQKIFSNSTESVKSSISSLFSELSEP